jgi:hypothetical protein
MTAAMRNENASHVDFGFMRGMIPANPFFMPSNIDMIIERKGRFIFGEWKREGEQMKLGQKILLMSLAKHHTVLLITGYSQGDDTNVSKVQVVTCNGKLNLIGNTKESLIQYLQDWYNASEKGEL